MNKIEQILLLIDSEEKFIHGDLARNKKDVAVDPTDARAVKFDMLGALMRLHNYQPLYEKVECVSYPPKAFDEDKERLTAYLQALYPKCRYYSLGAINDMLTYEGMKQGVEHFKGME